MIIFKYQTAFPLKAKVYAFHQTKDLTQLTLMDTGQTLKMDIRHKKRFQSRDKFLTLTEDSPRQYQRILTKEIEVKLS